MTFGAQAAKKLLLQMKLPEEAALQFIFTRIGMRAKADDDYSGDVDCVRELAIMCGGGGGWRSPFCTRRAPHTPSPLRHDRGRGVKMDQATAVDILDRVRRRLPSSLYGCLREEQAATAVRRSVKDSDATTAVPAPDTPVVRPHAAYLALARGAAC